MYGFGTTSDTTSSYMDLAPPLTLPLAQNKCFPPVGVVPLQTTEPTVYSLEIPPCRISNIYRGHILEPAATLNACGMNEDARCHSLFTQLFPHPLSECVSAHISSPLVHFAVATVGRGD